MIPGGDTGTDSAIQLEVFAGENLVLREEIDDTSQSDLERGTSNWYVMDSLVPFTRGEVQAGGRIVLSILGDDAWKPQMLFVFGLDTASGRPEPGGVLGLAAGLGAAGHEHGHRRRRSLGRLR